MPKVQVIQSNFTSGVLSPLMSSRVDLQVYNSGAETIENFVVLPHGGVKRRGGLHYTATAKTQAFKEYAIRLVRFQFSNTQTYVLEFGHLYIRFHKDRGQIVDGGGVPIEVVTPYDYSDLYELQFAQSADTLYIVHPEYAPRKLIRFSHTDWELVTITFNPPPTAEDDTDLATTLTPAATTGTGVTFTAGAAVWEDADINRLIVYRSALAVIRTVTGGGPPYTTCTADILNAFPSTALIASGQWKLSRSPQTTITPTAAGPEGATTTMTLSARGFRAADAGKYIYVNGGLSIITAYVDQTHVTVRICSKMSSITAADANAWSLEVAAWGTTPKFYPGTVAFWGDRLFFGGSPYFPQTIWGSVVGDYENFAKGSLADKSLSFTLGVGDVNRIKWMFSRRSLFMGTEAGEFRVTASPEGAALTPTNFLVLPETSHGSQSVTPIMSGDVIIFVQRNRKKIRELIYNWETDSYTSREVSFKAEHLFTESTIVDVAIQRFPEQIIYFVRADGKVIMMSLDRNLDFYACSLMTTPEISINGVCVVPDPSGVDEDVYMVSHKVTSGLKSVARYIAYLDSALYVDLGITYSGALTGTLGSLDHMASWVVDVVGNGAVYPQATVPAVPTYQITVTPQVTTAQVGLHFDCTLKTLPPEVVLANTAQGVRKRWNELIARVYATTGLTINGRRVWFRKGYDYMDLKVPEYTGDVITVPLGWDRLGQVTIVQDQPQPVTILSIVGSLLVSSGE